MVEVQALVNLVSQEVEETQVLEAEVPVAPATLTLADNVPRKPLCGWSLTSELEA